MKKICTDEEFYTIRDFVIANSTRPNNDRCCILLFDPYEITMCFNEKTNSIYICRVSNILTDNNKIIEVDDIDIDSDKSNLLLNEMYTYIIKQPEITLESSLEDIIKYKKGQALLKFYNEVIHNQTECCELNE